eukprot:362155-Chlamydomonas_euryale.AAC.1
MLARRCSAMRTTAAARASAAAPPCLRRGALPRCDAATKMDRYGPSALRDFCALCPPYFEDSLMIFFAGRDATGRAADLAAAASIAAARSAAAAAAGAAAFAAAAFAAAGQQGPNAGTGGVWEATRAEPLPASAPFF